MSNSTVIRNLPNQAIKAVFKKKTIELLLAYGRLRDGS